MDQVQRSLQQATESQRHRVFKFSPRLCVSVARIAASSVFRRAEALASADTRTLMRALYGEMQIALALRVSE